MEGYIVISQQNFEILYTITSLLIASIGFIGFGMGWYMRFVQVRHWFYAKDERALSLMPRHRGKKFDKLEEKDYFIPKKTD